MDSVKEEIAATAARMVVEEGLEYGPAKRRAAQQLGFNGRGGLPDNDTVEQAVQDYIAIFCADTQPQELRTLRELALVWLDRLAPLRPHLSGAVWRGTATRLSDIYVQLFCDDPKAAELALIDKGLRFEVGSVQGFRREMVDVLSLSVPVPAWSTHVGVHFLVYDYDDMRGALRPDTRGRTLRGDAPALRELLHDADHD